LEESLSFIDIRSFQDGDSQQINTPFFSKLLSLFFKNQKPKESFKNISKLIVLLLNTPGIEISTNYFQGNTETIVKEIYYEFKSILERESENEVNEYFKTLEQIPPLITECPEITNKQKLDYCNIERCFMKLYLKDLLIKLKNY
jgi:hypothetical protein